MNEHDLIRFMGRFPDKINPTTRMVSKKWKCSKCNLLYSSEEEIEIPAPCVECGSIFFETVRDSCINFGNPESDVGSCIDCSIENDSLFEACLECSKRK